MASSRFYCSYCGSANTSGTLSCHHCGLSLLSGGSMNQALLPTQSVWQKISRRVALQKITIGIIALPLAVGSVYVEGKRLLDARKFLVYSGHQMVADAAWSPDGTRVASTGIDETVVQVWDAASGRKLLICQLEETEHRRFPADVVWSADGKYLIAAVSESEMIDRLSLVQVWDAASGRRVRSMRVVPFADAGAEDLGDRLNMHYWTLNERYLAVVVGDTRIGTTVEIWEIATGNKISTIVPADRPWVLGMAWAPRSGRLAVLTNQSWEIWDAPVGKMTETFLAQDQAQEEVVAWSPDGKSIALGGTIFDVETGHMIGGEMFEGELMAVAWSPDGKRMATLCNTATGLYVPAANTMSIIDVSNDRVIATYDETRSESVRIMDLKKIAWSPDGKNLMEVKSSGIKIWKNVG